jgi:pimeloyl-ACP methyl ester carboxylesterase
MIDHAEAVLHDGTTIPITIHGRGRSLLLPVRVAAHPAAEADTMRQWGADPDLGPTLVHGLARTHRVIAADYEGHRMGHPAPHTLTPGNVAADLLAIADAGGADKFVYYGYSWLALSGLQLALRTDRLWALVMGGYPPMGGPYRAMLAVTRAAHAMSSRPAEGTASDPADVTPGDWDAVSIHTTDAQTRQFVTLYEALEGFDDTALSPPDNLPRLAFAGADDQIDYGPDWGSVRVRIGAPLAENADALTAAGWDVQVLPGLDHLSAMHGSVVLPILEGWLATVAEK